MEMVLAVWLFIAIIGVAVWFAGRGAERDERREIKKYFRNPGDFMSDYDLEQEYRRRVTADPTGFRERVASRESWASSLAVAVLAEWGRGAGRSVAMMPEFGRPEGLRPFAMEASGISSSSPVGDVPPLTAPPEFRRDRDYPIVAGPAEVAANYGPVGVDMIYGSGMVAAFYGAPSTQPVWDQHRDSSRRGGIGDA